MNNKPKKSFLFKERFFVVINRYGKEILNK